MLHEKFLSLGPFVFCLLATLCWPAFGQGISVADTYPEVHRIFPTADRFGALQDTPPAAAVYRADELLGYAFVTKDVAPIPAYSGKPVNLLVGIDGQGVIVGTKVIEHHEPILLVGIPEQALYDFARAYTGKSVLDRVKVGAGKRAGYINIDAITGATVTVMVINETIMRAARKVAVSRGLIEPAPEAQLPPARVREELFEVADWKFLTGNGAIRRLLLTRSDIDAAFLGTAAENVDRAASGEQGEVFIDLYYAYLNAPTIGRNLLGEFQYNWLMSELKPGEHAIAVMANGPYSFKGSGFVRGGIFDRVQLAQNSQAITFRDLDYHRLSDVYAAGMPKFKEMAIFVIRPHYQFDPGRPWRLELLVHRAVGPLKSIFSSFTGEYEIPETYIERPEPPPTPIAAEPEPVWVMVWRERSFQIAVLIASLMLLALVLLFQDWLVRRPKLLSYVRNGFLIYTLLFIGWYALAQLSVVNVLTFVHSVMHEFRWETFLVDPLIFILWAFVAVVLLLWGRGIYCGWLCPFGALQELVNKLVRRFHVKQLEFPTVVHERLWVLKYIVLIALFGVSLQSLAEAERYAEVEPFKTAITLRFQREWGYLLYAVGLVLISLFNRKFYCKYLCPLGAALAIPGRLRLFDWLRRHKECGKPCQICALECEVQAIRATGEINANECHYCLDCQMTYWDQYKCPPRVQRRKRHERARTARESVHRMEEMMGTVSGLVAEPVKPETDQLER